MSKQQYTIEGMDCASCAQKVETGVVRLPGASAARVDFATNRLHVEGTVAPADVEKRVRALGYQAIPVNEGQAGLPRTMASTRGGIRGFFDYLMQRRTTQLVMGSGGLIGLGLLGTLLSVPSLLTAMLFALAMALVLPPIALSGWNTLRINHAFSIDLLMTIAALGALVIEEHIEASVVIFLFAIGEALEGYTTDRARNSLRSLIELVPDTALRITADGQEAAVPVEDLQVGDRILVKDGEKIPMDGVVLEGESSVNQAPITGESVPVYKQPSDEVFAGSINGNGTLAVEVTKLAQDNTLSRLIQLVEEAQSVRAPSQRVINQFAAWYTPLVLVLAVLTATIPPLVFGQPFHDPVNHTGGWLYRALALLVIACPCALVISAPVTVISAITAAARRGVLIKGGVHLENLGTLKAIAFDKTGTLTQGEPQLTLARSVECENGETCQLCDDVLALAAAVERRSAHPLAKAVVDGAQMRGVVAQYAPAEGVEALAGYGVRGQVGGQTVTIGSHRYFDKHYQHSPALCAQVDAAQAQGQTTMLLHADERVRGFLAVADTVREESQPVIQALREQGIQTIMLTGDNPTVAQAIGRQVGVDRIHADLLPQDKVDELRALLAEYGSVAMVGDGINDAPALATATVGIAMGGAGSAQALETADVALMADDLHQLPVAVRLAAFARRLIKQNVVLSVGLKALFVVLALGGMATLWMAILADVGMSLLVTLNGMRPLRFKS